MRIFVTIILCVFAAIAANAQTVFTLPRALDSARVNNAILKAQVLDIDVSQTDIISARLRPNLSFGIAPIWIANKKYLPEGTHTFDAGNTQLSYQLGKAVQLPVQRRSRLETANKNVAVSKVRYAEGVRTFSLNVGTSWIGCWALKNKMALLQETKVGLDSLVKVIDARYKGGAVSLTDLRRTRLLLTQNELQTVITTQQYQNELLNLKLLTGSSDSIDIDLHSPIETVAFSTNVDSLAFTARELRTDVQLQKNTIAAAESNLRFQKSLAYPLPTVGGIYNPQNGIPYVGLFLGIDLPVFNRNQGEIKKAVVIKRQAEQQLAGALQQVQTDVVTAYQAFMVQKQNVRAYTGILSESQQILDNVKAAYLHGATTLVDFLDAQRNWYDTRQLYYDARQAYYQSYIQVLSATGQIDKL